MLITVKRFTSDSDSTLSLVSVDNKFMCFGVEDEHRDVKVSKETRIPAGYYDIKVRKVGGFHNRYKKRFDWHVGMLHIIGVKNFKYVLVHIGNTERDTDACLCVGYDGMTSGGLKAYNSTQAYKALYLAVIGAALAGELKIHYIDIDHADH